MQRTDAAEPDGGDAGAAPGVPAEQVRDALAHLHDPAHLRTHPLAALVGGSDRAGRGPALRRVLLEAVEALEPARESAPGPRALRRYRLLKRRYVDGLAPEAVQGELRIGRSEYYREHQRALEAVASWLAERLGAAAVGPRSEPAGAHPVADARRTAPEPVPAVPPTGLPLQLTSFVGREREVAELSALVAVSPLVTLAGPGGVGKTRLALAVGEQAEHREDGGARLVELAALADEALVPTAVATALGVSVRSDPLEALTRWLGGRPALLLLDNCEHLIGACAGLVEPLLRACPGLRVLATSREPLGVPGEVVYRVDPLPPDQAVRLFVERAGLVRPSFALAEANRADVARVCARLNGVPLAVELAAARVAALSPAEIAERLDAFFDVPSDHDRARPPRHRTLRAAFAWSYDLLDAAERTLFGRLSVFAGGCTLEAAEAVCRVDGDILDLLSALVGKSLLRTASGPAEGPRFNMLETAREYAAERLAEWHGARGLRQRHADHFLALAERAEPLLYGRGQLAELDRLDGEHDNLRAALLWSVESGDADRSARLAWALRRFWWVRGHTAEGRTWLARVVALARVSGDAGALARALTAAALLTYVERDRVDYEPMASESIALWRRLGDSGGLAESLHLLGHAWLDRDGGQACARDLFAESAGHYRAAHLRWGLAWSLNCQGTAERELGADDAARRAFEDSLALFQAVGDDDMVAHALGNLGLLALDQGDPVQARALLDESVALFRALGDRLYLARDLQRRGDVACHDGDLATAAQSYRESLGLAAEVGARLRVAYALEGLAILAVAQAQPDRALRLAGAAAALRDAVGQPRRLVERARFDGALDRARTALGAAAAAAWGQGRRTNMDQAITLALTPPVGTGPELLTRREQDVVRLVARGFSNRQIAEHLVIADGTARIHVERILAKLGFRSRTQVAAWAAQRPELCLSTDAQGDAPA